VFSNEPGYYKEGEYGIRIENLLVTVESAELGESGTPFYQFEDLTVCPIETRLINPNLLDAEELRWLNAYHRRVYKTLAPLLEKEDKSWLKTACASV
jgi:Xaa-Pro aminopeptidase